MSHAPSNQYYISGSHILYFPDLWNHEFHTSYGYHAYSHSISLKHHTRINTTFISLYSEVLFYTCCSNLSPCVKLTRFDANSWQFSMQLSCWTAMRHDTESSQYLRSNSLGYFSLLSHFWWKYYSLFLSIKYNIFHSCHDQAVISSFGCRIVKWSIFTILRRKYFHQICRMNEKSFQWVPCLCISQHDSWWSAMGELWKLASTLNIMTTTSNVWYVCHISE